MNFITNCAESFDNFILNLVVSIASIKLELKAVATVVSYASKAKAIIFNIFKAFLMHESLLGIYELHLNQKTCY